MIGKQEGIEYLLAAVHHLVRERGRTDIHVALVGDGPHRPRLEAQAAALGIGEHVDFLGRLPDREAITLLNTADVCVNPDEFNDLNNYSTMNKIMEYMCLGKPIVQFDMIEGRYSAGDASLYARPNDARDFADKIATLLDDAEQRARRGRLGRDRVLNHLAWHHQAPTLLEAYRALSLPHRPALRRVGQGRGPDTVNRASRIPKGEVP